MWNKARRSRSHRLDVALRRPSFQHNALIWLDIPARRARVIGAAARA
jgi:hypothetical protein